MANLIKKIRTDKGDLQIDYGALANLPSINNNLLINSDFRNPINQRGLTSVTTNDSEWGRVYFIDRWYAQHGASVSVQSGYIKASASATTDEGYVCQPFEQEYANGTYTLTVNVKSVSGTVKVFGAVLTQGMNSITVTEAVGSIEFKLLPSSSIELYWAKFEGGASSTLFVPRIYAEELAMCQRFYRTYKDDDFAVLTQTYTSTTTTNGRFNLQPEMYKAPTITIHSLEVKDIKDGNTVTLTSTANQSLCNKVVEISGIHASMTVGPRYMYAKMDLDAEIR